jgi:hypothetical protein
MRINWFGAKTPLFESLQILVTYNTWPWREVKKTWLFEASLPRENRTERGETTREKVPNSFYLTDQKKLQKQQGSPDG